MRHVMRRLDDHGDTETRWEPDDKESLRKARNQFALHMEEGGMAFSVPTDPREPAEVIRKFDPEATEIILAPRLVGG